MNRLPWAPLNAGVFLIIFGGVFLVSFFNIGILNLGTALPFIFTFFGVWMVAEAFIIPPATAYSPPRIMVAGWGSLIAGLGLLWLVGTKLPDLLPIALSLLVVIAGIAAVGYAFIRAKPNTPKTSTS